MSFNKERVFTTPKEILRPNEIPAVMVVGETLAEVWENSVLATMEFGCRMPSESFNCSIDNRVTSMMMMVGNPFAEPRISREFPEGLPGLYKYTLEVVEGLHGERVEGWDYSYYDRLFNWPGKINKIFSGEMLEIPHLDQINELVNKLEKSPFSRRAQAVTWYPLIDARHDDPPCLQRIWGQVVQTSEDEYLFEMNTSWRSRDAFKAAFMNLYALTELQKRIALRISELSGKKVGVGRYCDVSDNYHIYGLYEEKGEIAGFLNRMEKRSFEQRTYRSDDKIVLQEFGFAAEEILREKN